MYNVCPQNVMEWKYRVAEGKGRSQAKYLKTADYCRMVEYFSFTVVRLSDLIFLGCFVFVKRSENIWSEVWSKMMESNKEHLVKYIF